MTDVFNMEMRSSIMRSVKSGNTKSTELKLLNFFKINKIKGWRRNFKLFGKPDFVFPKQRIVIFTDGCFWHGHNCRNTIPKDNSEYWKLKVEKNKLRDELVNKTLIEKNWNVIRIWECEISKEATVKKLISMLYVF